jgi:DNA polymerase-3 subunit delta'
MYFKDIPGKKDEKQQLIQQVKLGKIPHAQLFLGKEGYGELALAIAFSRFIMCHKPEEDDACGKCEACKKIDHYMKPDLHFVFPMVKYKNLKREDTTSNDALPVWRQTILENPWCNLSQWLEILEADNSIPNINVKECNDIIHKLSLMAFDSGYKILILWLPEFLGKDGNRLLKLIEEPPDKTLLLLVSHHVEGILPTLISRCQILRVPPFERDEIVGFLIEKYNVSQKRALEISNMSAGNLLNAISVCNHDTKDYSDMLISWFRIAYSGNPVTIQEWYLGFEQLSKNEKMSFIEYGLHFLRQFLLFQFNASESLHSTEQEKETLQKMQKVLDIGKAEAIISVFDRQLMAIQRNANLKIMFLTDSLTIGDIMNGKEYVSLLSY